MAALISSGCFYALLPDHFVHSVWRLKNFKAIPPEVFSVGFAPRESDSGGGPPDHESCRPDGGGPLRFTVPQFHATAVTLSSSSGDLSLTTTRHSHDARDALLKSAITRSVESNFRRTAAFGTVATRRSALL
jgi:hypothetical protein